MWLNSMELAGVEPASESPSIAASPITVYLFYMPLVQVLLHVVPSIGRRQTGFRFW